MADQKKGFILYADQKELFDQLPNDKAGELIKHIFSYVNDEDPTSDDLLINLAFTPIKQQLKRDLKKFEATKEQRSNAGKRSAEVRREQRKLTALNPVEREPTKATVIVNDTVTVNDNVTVTDNVKVKENIKEIDNTPIKIGGVSIANIRNEEFEKFWVYYDKKVGKMKTLKKWIKLSKEDIQGIKATLKDYINSTPDKNFRKDPLTYLNGEAWNDEIVNFEKPTTENKQDQAMKNLLERAKNL